MAMIGNPDKDKIRREFETMKLLELSAAEQYARIAGSPGIEQPGVKTAFAGIAEDERRHAELVDRVIHLINNAL